MLLVERFLERGPTRAQPAKLTEEQAFRSVARKMNLALKPHSEFFKQPD